MDVIRGFFRFLRWQMLGASEVRLLPCPSWKGMFEEANHMRKQIILDQTWQCILMNVHSDLRDSLNASHPKNHWSFSRLSYFSVDTIALCSKPFTILVTFAGGGFLVPLFNLVLGVSELLPFINILLLYHLCSKAGIRVRNASQGQDCTL